MQGKLFDTIKVKTGTAGVSGDFRKTKAFKGIEVAFVRTFQNARHKDDRGIDYTLYLTPRRTFRVHWVEWSRWENEVDIYHLSEEMSLPEIADKYPAVYNALEEQFFKEHGFDPVIELLD